MDGVVIAGDGCRIRYRLDGPAAAPVLLLSNSLGTTLSMWEPQMAAFARAHRVLRYDTRGHGGSDAPAGAYSMDRLGRDVVELLDALALATVDVCGLSLGGMVGQWLGYRAPERVGSLVLANTAAVMGPPATWDARIALVGREGMEPLAQASAARWFTPGFAARRPDAVAPILAALRATSPVGYAGCCAAIRDMDMRRTNTLQRGPALVIGGTADPATPPADSEALAAALADARLAFLDAAHLSNVEQPAAFAELVVRFLADRRSDQGARLA